MRRAHALLTREVDRLAAVAVSWVQGCAVQAMVDPDNFDVDQNLAAVLALSGRGAA